MNVPEYLRERAVTSLFSMDVFAKSFAIWKPKIEQITGTVPDFYHLLNVGDYLGEIFRTTRTAGRDQGTLSGGGSSWEGLVCWYLNLCLLGSRSVVIKHSKNLLPPCIGDAITVNYGSFASNTESDLIALTFPNSEEYLQPVEKLSADKKFGYVKAISNLCARDFRKLEVGVIQCKTNWNDNAQIPMLWAIVYSSTNFSNRNITIGRNAFNMTNFKSFFYSFVTVPTNSLTNYTTSSLCVKRVYNLTGGNYWGQPTRSGIAQSLKEIFNRNFISGIIRDDQKADVDSQLAEKSKLSYFNISL